MNFFQKIWDKMPSFTDNMVAFGLENKQDFKIRVWSSSAGQIELTKGSSFIRGVSNSDRFEVEIGKMGGVWNRDSGLSYRVDYPKSRLVIDKNTKEEIIFKNHQKNGLNKQNLYMLTIWMEKALKKTLDCVKENETEYNEKRLSSILSLNNGEYKIVDDEDYKHTSTYRDASIRNDKVLMILTTSSGEMEVSLYEEVDFLKQPYPCVSVRFIFRGDKVYNFDYYISSGLCMPDWYENEQFLTETIEEAVGFVRNLFKTEEVKTLPKMEMVEKTRKITLGTPKD